MIVSLGSMGLGVGPSHGWGRMWRRLGVVSALALVVSVVVPAQPVWAETIQDQQWYLDTLHVEEAHQTARGEGITVAVVDSGVGECDDLEGQVMDTGYSPLNDGSGFDWDVVGHGTGMAGIIAATGVDEDHYLGIAPEATIMSVFISSMDDLTGAQRAAGEGIRWAVDNGADIINLSVGWEGEWPDDSIEAVEYALSKGVLLVAGTGNVADDGSDLTTVKTPANLPGVIAVTGTDEDGNLADFAIRGEGTILAAPAADIPLVQPDNLVLTTGETYSDPIGGTSNSTAIVSAAAALVWSAYPDLTANDVIQRLITTADDRGAAGYDTEYGYGELNLVEALTADVPRVVANPLTSAGASANASAASAGVEPGSSDGDGGDQTGDGGGTSVLPILFGTLGVLAVAVAAGVFVLRRDRRARSRGW